MLKKELRGSKGGKSEKRCGQGPGARDMECASEVFTVHSPPSSPSHHQSYYVTSNVKMRAHSLGQKGGKSESSPLCLHIEHVLRPGSSLSNAFATKSYQICRKQNDLHW